MKAATADLIINQDENLLVAPMDVSIKQSIEYK